MSAGGFSSEIGKLDVCINSNFNTNQKSNNNRDYLPQVILKKDLDQISLPVNYLNSNPNDNSELMKSGDISRIINHALKLIDQPLEDSQLDKSANNSHSILFFDPVFKNRKSQKDKFENLNMLPPEIEMELLGLDLKNINNENKITKEEVPVEKNTISKPTGGYDAVINVDSLKVLDKRVATQISESIYYLKTNITTDEKPGESLLEDKFIN